MEWGCRQHCQDHAHRDGEAECLGVNITDIHTTLVGEEDLVAFAVGVDADIVFGVGWVREERLYDEVVEGAGSALDLKRTNIVSTSSKSRSRK